MNFVRSDSLPRIKFREVLVTGQYINSSRLSLTTDVITKPDRIVSEDHNGLVGLLSRRKEVRRAARTSRGEGTRMPVDDIIENWEAGVDEPDIAENFQLPIEQVEAILSYAVTHQNAPRPVR